MSERSHYNERKTLELLAKGDENAFANLYDHHWQLVHKIARHYLDDDDNVMDAVQEVFVKVWQRRELFSNVENFQYYLVGITRKTVLKAMKKDMRRKQLFEQFIAGVPQSENLEDKVVEADYKRFLNELVEMLPPQQKIVFRLSRLEDKDNHEIAKQLNITYNTVRAHLNSARSFLRTHLRHHVGAVAATISLII